MGRFLPGFEEKDIIRGEEFVRLFSFILFLEKGNNDCDKGVWKEYEKFLCEKRRRWFEEKGKKLVNDGSLEDLYRVFREYFGLDEKNHVILERTERKIVIGSMNPCPVLYACMRLNLDTREICKKIYEKPTTYLLKLVNPRARFYRDYSRIRPYYYCCVEIIELPESSSEEKEEDSEK